MSRKPKSTLRVPLLSDHQILAIVWTLSEDLNVFSQLFNSTYLYTVLLLFAPILRSTRILQQENICLTFSTSYPNSVSKKQKSEKRKLKSEKHLRSCHVLSLLIITINNKLKRTTMFSNLMNTICFFYEFRNRGSVSWFSYVRYNPTSPHRHNES